MSRKIEVQILGDSKSLEAALGRAQQKTSRFGRGLQVASRVAGGALIGLGVAAKIGADEINDSQRAMAQTTAVLKSTGGQANVTADHIVNLAQKLLHLSGVDDEAIQGSENLMLTFRNVRNEVGKGNDIFDQATKATLDLSVAMGKDLNSSTILVGKALNDPIKGMSALRRVGVSLSDAQEKLVKHLVNTGHTMKAQKIILGELRKEFGGSAKAAGQTLAGQIGKLKESFADVAAMLVTSLLPSFQMLLGVLNKAAGWMKRNETATKILVGTIAALAAGVLVVNGIYKVWTAVTRSVTAAQWLLNAAMDANPAVIITAAIIGLGVALVIAYKKSETFRHVVNASFSAVKHVVDVVVGVLKGPLTSAFNIVRNVGGRVIDFMHDHWKLIATVVGGPVVGAIILVVSHMSTVRRIAGRVLDFFHDKWSSVTGPIKQVYNWIQNVIDKIGDLLSWISRIHWPSPPGWLTANFGDVFGGGSSGNSPSRGGGGRARPQAVASTRFRVAPVHVHIDLNGREIASALVSENRTFKRQSGRGLFD